MQDVYNHETPEIEKNDFQNESPQSDPCDSPDPVDQENEKEHIEDPLCCLPNGQFGVIEHPGYDASEIAIRCSQRSILVDSISVWAMIELDDMKPNARDVLHRRQSKEGKDPEGANNAEDESTLHFTDGCKEQAENDEQPKKGTVAEKIKMFDGKTTGTANRFHTPVTHLPVNVMREDVAIAPVPNTVKTRIEEFERLVKHASNTEMPGHSEDVKTAAVFPRKSKTNDSTETLEVSATASNTHAGNLHQGEAPEVVSLLDASGNVKEEFQQADSSETNPDNLGFDEHENVSYDTNSVRQVVRPDDDGDTEGCNEGCCGRDREQDANENRVPGEDSRFQLIFQPGKANAAVGRNSAHEQTSSASTSESSTGLTEVHMVDDGSKRITQKNRDLGSEFMRGQSVVIHLLMEWLASVTDVSKQEILLELISALGDGDSVLPPGVLSSLMNKSMVGRRVKSPMEREIIDCLRFLKHNKLLVMDVDPPSLASLHSINRTSLTWEWLIARNNPSNDGEVQVNELLRYNQDISLVPSDSGPIVRMEMDESAADVSNCPDPFSPTLECEMVDDDGPVVED